MADGWIRPNFLRSDVGPGARGTRVAGGNIPANRFIKFSSENVVVAGAADTAVAGISVEDEAKILADDVRVCYTGEVEGLADVNIAGGMFVKSGTLGVVVPALTGALAGATIEDNVGLGFANQPANDGLEILSASAADTMQVTIYGTTNGGVVVVKETVTLTGTSAVSTVKTDWGVVLGFEIPLGQRLSAGTITLREASGNATVSTLTAGARQKGVVNVPTANQVAYNHIISVVADSGTTKTVGVVGTTAAGVAQMEAVVLTGATAVNFTNSFQKVQKILVGDLEVARTATFKTDTTLDSASVIVGMALEDKEAGELVKILLQKNIPSQSVASGGVALGDNLGVAFSFAEATNSYLRFVTTNDAERVTLGKLLTMPVQVIDMADAQVALVYGTAGAGQVKITGQLLFVDANSGATEDLLLPPVATSSGMIVFIFNTGGEDIILKDATDAITVATISTTECAFAACNGTVWLGGVVKLT